MAKKIKFGIVGLGYWGPNYARVLGKIDSAQLSWCVDFDESNLKKMKKINPGVRVSRDYRDILRDRNVQAVIIATPPNTHFQITKDFLQAGKHILVEKPFSKNIEEASQLINLAERNRKILMVGYTYIYHPAIEKIRKMIDKLGLLYYIKAERLGLGPIRKQVSALEDLGVHDISIIIHLLKRMPRVGFKMSTSFLQKGIEDFVSLGLRFPKNIFVSITSSWFAPEKIRRILFVGSDGMIVFNDVDKQRPITFYKRKVDKKLLNSTPFYKDHQNLVKLGNVSFPFVKSEEPLKRQILHFIDSILKERKPLTDGHFALKVLKVLKMVRKCK